MSGNKKAIEDIGFQIARFANRLRSLMKRFENCPARATKNLDLLRLFLYSDMFGTKLCRTTFSSFILDSTY